MVIIFEVLEYPWNCRIWSVRTVGSIYYVYIDGSVCISMDTAKGNGYHTTWSLDVVCILVAWFLCTVFQRNRDVQCNWYWRITRDSIVVGIDRRDVIYQMEY